MMDIHKRIEKVKDKVDNFIKKDNKNWYPFNLFILKKYEIKRKIAKIINQLDDYFSSYFRKLTFFCFQFMIYWFHFEMI